MTRFKKLILAIIGVMITIGSQLTVSADADKEYIVKIKPEICLLSMEDENLVPWLPEFGLYTTDDISDLEPDIFEYIEEDAPVELFDTYDYNYIADNSEYEITGIKNMWDMGVYGKGIRVGVIDSGCNAHKALAENLCEGKSFVDGVDDTNDNIGHGTSVCGVTAASYGFGTSIGTAHKASIVPLKFIDRDSDGNVIGGTTKRLVNAIIAATDDFQCDIINISSGTIASYTLKTAVDYAVSKGLVITAAVGNTGTTAYNYPAAYDNVIGVGSVNKSKEHSEFSNMNDSVFISAPSEDVQVLSGVEAYANKSGTSFSAPYVSGIIADMLEIDPELTVEKIRNIISRTAEDLGDEGYDENFGYGMIRVDNIINYMLDGKKGFVSPIDLCSADGVYEIRFLLKDEQNLPALLFAEYMDGRLNNVVSETERVNNNIYMLRLNKTDKGEMRYFIWYSKSDMKPFDIGN